MEEIAPLISIIVPSYNHEKYLVQRLESIFKQTYTNFEVILLDDCSTDNSKAILLEFAKNPKVTHTIFNEMNSGNTFIQWNLGISLAKGDYIWIAETDDYCDIHFLEKLIQPFQKDKQVVLAYCQSNRVNNNCKVTGNWITHTNDLDAELFSKDFTMNSNEFIEKFLIYKNVIPNASAVVFRMSAIDINIHLDMDLEYRYCGDWMFYLKLIINKKVAFVGESLNNFRYHSSSVIANAVKSENRVIILDMDFNMRQVLMKYLKQNTVENYNEISKNNNFIKRNYVYEKAFLLIKTGNKIKGSLLLLSVFDLYFKKNIKLKFKKVFLK